ncbi:16090_t:CDS:2 [Funneliformis geosporum]|uniref:2003_t:CDS:1 n=1 Tax=Funneliformis geosporum TaxID=1117311 RepID=A0A9W4WSG6_9GLOM|nr:16090_t:CDS:2 [Funneliformis geosporum]CAI2182861.1 2003_t:CDS:2 [Funneliformis geosporum]
MSKLDSIDSILVDKLPKPEEIFQLKNDYIEGEPLKFVWMVEEHLTETLWWPSKNNEENLILFVVPGNPGVIDYYFEFLNTIHHELGKKIDIVGVSMLGHSHGPHNPSLKNLYSLQDQIDHKIQCVDKLRSQFTSQEDGKQPKFIICGHSIGAYVGSQVLKARPNHGIENIYALFPTLQNMVKTPNGMMMNFLFNERARSLAASTVVNLRYFVPQTLFKFFVSQLTRQKESMIDITLSALLHGHVVENALYMADIEMKTVCELDEEFYREHIDKFIFYFSEGDKWAPLEHYEDMKNRFPEGRVLLCEKNTPHAFVLDHGEVMGKKVAGWMLMLP